MNRVVLAVAALMLAGCGAQPQAPVAVQASAQDAQAKGVFNRPVPVTHALNEVFADYDHNRNGQIDLRLPSGYVPPYMTHDERIRKETTRSVERDRDGRITRIIYTTHTYSLQDLFTTADLDRNGVITGEELQGLVVSFDQDHDGQLTRRGLWGWLTRKEKGEYDLYQSQYGESRIDVRRDVIDVRNRAAQEQIEAEAHMVETETPDEDLKSAFEPKAGTP
ncbi:EF hand [compost metagenome]